MFVGHAAVALAANARAPRVSLGVLVAAAFGLDLLWPVFLLLGVERVSIEPGNTAFTPLRFDSYPWSHSLLFAVVWSGVAGGATYRALQDRGAASLVGALVLSHWVLDVVTHRPDLPLWPGAGAPRIGLGLWHSVPGTLAVEGLLFIAGIVVFLRVTRARDRVGGVMLWLLLAFFTTVWLGGLGGPPPPSPSAVAWVALAGWLLPLWAGSVGRHREPRGAG